MGFCVNPTRILHCITSKGKRPDSYLMNAKRIRCRSLFPAVHGVLRKSDEDLTFHNIRALRNSAPGRSAPMWRRATSASSARGAQPRSEEHTSELQSPCNLVCRLLLE